MKKILKFINIILVLTIIISLLGLTFPIKYTYASSIGDIMSSADSFISDGASGSTPIDDTKLQDMSNTIYNVLLVIAIIIAVGFGLVVGIKFMTGSVGEKAKVKETLIPYIAGCIVIFGAFGIWKLVVSILRNV